MSKWVENYVKGCAKCQQNKVQECEGRLVAKRTYRHQACGFSSQIVPPLVCNFAPTFDLSVADCRKQNVITVLHGHHRPQDWPVIDALRLDQQLLLQPSFWSAVSQGMSNKHELCISRRGAMVPMYRSLNS